MKEELLNELAAREQELIEKWDELSERLDEEGIRYTAEFPELDEEYYETQGAMSEVRRTIELIQKIFN